MADNDPGRGYDRPDLRAPGGGLHLHLDRLVFLEKICDLVPECLQDLYDHALSEEDVDSAVSEWASRWNLVDPWILDVARETFRIYSCPDTHQQRRRQSRRVYEWNRPLQEEGDIPSHWMRWAPDPDDLEPPYRELRFYGLGHAQPGLDLESLRENPFLRTPAPVKVPGWPPDPEVDSESEARVAFERWWREQKRAAREAGASESRQKRSHTGGDPHLHFSWLARWQVGGESQKEIAENPGEGVRKRERQTVQEAITRTADRIGLTRRTEL